MAFIIDLDNVSFEQVKLNITNMLEQQPDYAQWESFYGSAAGTTLIELCASLATYLSQKTTVARRETYLPYVKNRTSAVAIAETLTYSVFRGHNDYLYLVIQATSTTSLAKYAVVGTVKNKDLILLEPANLTSGSYYILPVVVGEEKEENLTVPSSDLQLFRFTSENVSDDIRIYIDTEEVDLGDNMSSLSDDKYIALTNTLTAVDVMFLNRCAITTGWSGGLYYDVGDFVVPTVSTGLIYRCDVYGLAGSVEPTWPTTEGQSVADNDTKWTAYKDVSYTVSDTLTLKYIELGETDYNIPDDLVFDYGTLNGCVYEGTNTWSSSVPYSLNETVIPTVPVNYVYKCTQSRLSTWVANKQYYLGDFIMPTTPDGCVYECIAEMIGALSGPTEPTWDTTVGNPTSDSGGLVTWSCVTDSITEPTWPTTVGDTVYVTHGDIYWECVEADKIASPHLEPETVSQIQVNTPVAFSTQQLVKSRDDYMKLFRSLSTKLVDTNYTDVSPAIVELTYVQNDLSNLTTVEKTNFIVALSNYKPMGLEDPTISDPIPNALVLDIVVYLKKAGTYGLSALIDTILTAREKVLEVELDLYSIENQISNLVDSNNVEFVKTSRVIINSSVWSSSTSYIIGNFVTPTTPGSYMYRCTNASITWDSWLASTTYTTSDYMMPTIPNGYVYQCTTAGTSASSEPTWTTSGTQNDGTAQWVPIQITEPTGTTTWPTTEGDSVTHGYFTWKCYSLTDITIDFDWNEYCTITKNLTII